MSEANRIRARLAGDADGAGPGAAPEARASPTPSWPSPPDRAAFHGVAGDIVRAVDPHSEADPVAILAQFLVAFGNAAGRSAGFEVEADFHATNLYAILVGATAKGRKGSSWGQAGRFVREADPSWRDRIVHGLSSGEGLIHAVRDPHVVRRQAKTNAERERADGDGYIEEVADQGVVDKRLCAVETEFTSALRMMGRDGSILSAVLRQAWERPDLRTLTKNNPTRAAGAHVSVVGHIAREELRRELSRTDAASGFANRFLFLCVRRSKLLPEGGSLTEAEVGPLVSATAAALSFARRARTMCRDEEARQLWREVYPQLSEGSPGMFGAVTSRAEAQVMRLAVLYALLDRRDSIGVEHLRAALALWAYAEASARYIFGDALGDPTADQILVQLRASPDGLTRTEIRDLFDRHKSASEIDAALALLAEEGLARRSSEPTGGRPIERWKALSALSSLSSQSLTSVKQASTLDSDEAPPRDISDVSQEAQEEIPLATDEEEERIARLLGDEGSS